MSLIRQKSKISTPPMQGRSLIPIFQKKRPADRGTIFWQWSKGKGVRHEHWRLVSDNNELWALYDMRIDRTETNNLVKEHPELAGKLDAMFRDWTQSNKKG